MIVYKITNLINGKIYIGQTTRTIEERFEEHKYAKSYIGKAIRKYGVENFKIGIIEQCQTKEELNERELYWISKCNSKAPNGYNLIFSKKFESTVRFVTSISENQISFVSMYQSNIEWLARQRLTGEQLSVLLYLFGKTDYNNCIRVTQKYIAEKLNMTQSHVSRALKTLKDMEIIVEEEREGLNKTYRFNPNVAHKGSYNYRDNVIEFNQLLEDKRNRS